MEVCGRHIEGVFLYFVAHLVPQCAVNETVAPDSACRTAAQMPDGGSRQSAGADLAELHYGRMAEVENFIEGLIVHRR